MLAVGLFPKPSMNWNDGAALAAAFYRAQGQDGSVASSPTFAHS
jgi:hypothetical protein